MSNTYTVKSGDTLGSIAAANKCSVADLRALNPIITDPNHIKTGWTLKLPIASAKALPPPKHAENQSTTAVKGAVECKDELVEVIHITGEEHFYVLTEKESNALKQQSDLVKKLMDELHQNLAKATEASKCAKTKDPQAACSCTRCVKDKWNAKAEEAGLVKRSTPPAEKPKTIIERKEDLQGQLVTVQQARDWYQRYTPKANFEGNYLESNWKGLQAKKIAELNSEIQSLRTRIAAQGKAEAGDSSTSANSAAPDIKYGKGQATDTQKGKQVKTGITTVEYISFRDPTRRHYISIRTREQFTWSVKVPTAVMQGKPLDKNLAKDLIKDIRNAVADGRKTSPLGSLEAKLTSWTSKDDNLLNALHKECSWTSNEADSAKYAVSAEAHAFRFAATASAGINSWEPGKGSIEVGVKGSAAISLAEGSIALKSFFPDQGGYVVRMPYRNAEGKEVVSDIGIFRLDGKVELSCFLGATAQGQAGVKAQYKPKEVEASGATALLSTPSVDVDKKRGGSLGLKGNAFAGVQGGGTVTGTLKWLDSTKQGVGKITAGQANDSGSTDWSSLVEIKAEGNAALGIGASFDFGIEISANRLAINCKASLVFGPGAGGGFGTAVDIEKIGDLIYVFCNALSKADFHYQLAVTRDAFNYMAAGLFKIATNPGQSVASTFEGGFNKMSLWWKRRETTKQEAQRLASYLLSNHSINVNSKTIPLHMLPPETIGPMLHLLTESFVESWAEDQENAIVLLLSHLRSWRHFIEVLEHCSKDGSKVNAMESLDRLNSLLDGAEQLQFNRFIGTLAININTTVPEFGMLAWSPSLPWRKEKTLIAAKRSNHFDGLA
ncbi:LysM peptidoglycan-binding domain-containing protein [Pseudomonas chlororaphis]|uniref:LysM peptidoglycan-binding domain-containing protein n=1 Tax=Pseudomonas chlororaphis TaxID=587753 RepID=UPI002367EF7E|nr:LysM domain-containing protein [Pseudomonas chlororaphis]WDH35667.1 LysM domain-containing protein [Pseudomonas chlororaphis]WDH41752.1 LysM domain-containing protein [Pseudomonas chlororaphis]